MRIKVMNDNVDWDDIKDAWDNGNHTLQEKAIEYEISVADILLYAKKEGWGPRGTFHVEIDLGMEPEQIVRQLTISNLASLSLRL
ncbi:hypothetical protein KAR91_14565, partial [Candidatus Pacearchaeota archaeon]|nr:hypothetical protein [Candidatus Pacearchaeota archaeon]